MLCKLKNAVMWYDMPLTTEWETYFSHVSIRSLASDYGFAAAALVDRVGEWE